MGTDPNQGKTQRGAATSSPAVPYAHLRNVAATPTHSKPRCGPWPTSLADRLSGAAPIEQRPPTSWAKVVKEGRTPWPIGSTLRGRSKPPEVSPSPSGWRPTAAPPTAPFFAPPVPTVRDSGVTWSLPVQQMQDLLSFQQDQRFQSRGRYQPPRGPRNPWASGPGW
ncbi:hypothetical protein, variant [Phytophthora nicotianae CJ01A1]|uniref:Uncharacterized protein n=1 Tax=Phytophthora nicotianae CJ01A1 TaxID=1317063 RepID=W2VX38_PHYNI|nr:hypothetical protein, variant [Phytophthora nicotianae CJ01A1]